jgi:uncharacterized OsmC-like protein
MTKFTAKIQNAEHQHQVTLSTGGNEHSITIAPKSTGFGSSMNGGEALLLALATCYCNDIYREAQNQGISVRHVAVEVEAEQDGQAGHAMEHIIYHVTVEADAPQEAIETLIRTTDTLAEIQNTLRQANTVTLGQITARSSGADQ